MQIIYGRNRRCYKSLKRPININRAKGLSTSFSMRVGETIYYVIVCR
jgi:hypothetical protein